MSFKHPSESRLDPSVMPVAGLPSSQAAKSTFRGAPIVNDCVYTNGGAREHVTLLPSIRRMSGDARSLPSTLRRNDISGAVPRVTIPLRTGRFTSPLDPDYVLPSPGAFVPVPGRFRQVRPSATITRRDIFGAAPQPRTNVRSPTAAQQVEALATAVRAPRTRAPAKHPMWSLNTKDITGAQPRTYWSPLDPRSHYKRSEMLDRSLKAEDICGPPKALLAHGTKNVAGTMPGAKRITVINRPLNFIEAFAL
ncbi:unnamed protein product [Pedinophyceae sp. YPF-701]|nr:unnamed protein product [Pedinophyceae sp. YPF-701]